MPSKPRKLFYLFPWALFFNTLLLLGLGLLNLYSAAFNPQQELSNFFFSQLLWIALSLLAMGAMLTFHYRHLFALAPALYGLSLLLLVSVVVFGKSSGGQQNWLALGPLRMQPSEFAKLSTVLMLARHFTKTGPNHLGVVKALLIVLLPMGLILLEKDVGAALFFVLIGIGFFFFAKISYRWLLGALVLLSLGGLVGYRHFLSEYQKGRIQTFLNPEKDPRGRGYHLLQSKVAVGSGRWWGKGFLKGDLNKLKFLPERHTDFVFPMLAEEWGFVGSVTVLASFVAFFLLLLQAASQVTDLFAGFLILGVAALFFWQMSVNLSGVLGMLPLAGVTLPFFSYGGSSLLTMMLGLGLAFNAFMRRYMF